MAATAAFSACLGLPADEVDAEDEATDVALDDRARAASRCNTAAPFGPPLAVTELNSFARDEGARLSPDELTLYFSSNRAGSQGGFDIYRATRPSRTSPFLPPAAVAGVNTAADERSPTVTSNDRDLYLATSATSSFDIARAHRGNTGAPFGAPMPVAAINSVGDDADPYVLPDHTAVYFASARGGNWDLFRAARVGGATQAPVQIAGGPHVELAPVVSPDELTLYFASSRPGGAGDLDIYIATRASTAQTFSAPVAVTGLNTTGADVPTWTSRDGCVLYYTRGETGDIFVATRGR